MKLEEIMKNIKVFVDPTGTSGCYSARVLGVMPDKERVNFEIGLSGCYTDTILQDTISAKLEEIFECKYHYEIGDIDESDVLYDGGNFK
jgi:hypothetical protein